MSNQFAVLSHYRYVFATPCVSWVVSEWLLRQLARSTLDHKLEIISKIYFAVKVFQNWNVFEDLNQGFKFPALYGKESQQRNSFNARFEAIFTSGLIKPTTSPIFQHDSKTF